MLIGQLLATNGSQQQVINNSKNNHNNNIVNDENGHTDLEIMKKIIDAFNQEMTRMK